MYANALPTYSHMINSFDTRDLAIYSVELEGSEVKVSQYYLSLTFVT